MTDKEKLEKAVKLADGMYYAAQYLTTDASRLRKAMDEYHQFIINDYCKEEPASEALEDAAYNFVMDNFGNPKEPLYKFDQRCFKAGAQWQKKQMMKNAIDGYIVRTKIGELKFFSVMPARYEDENLGIADWLVYGACISCSFGFSKLFPMLLWENEPLKVKLIITKE